jgi:thiamine monophosphate kinase
MSWVADPTATNKAHQTTGPKVWRGSLMAMPTKPTMTMACANSSGLPAEVLLPLCLSGGDDYELVFTAPEHQRSAIVAASEVARTQVTRIGKITASPQLTLLDSQGRLVANTFSSFDHFKTP